MPNKKQLVCLTVQMPDELRHAVRESARENDFSVSVFVRKMLRAQVEQARLKKLAKVHGGN